MPSLPLHVLAGATGARPSRLPACKNCVLSRAACTSACHDCVCSARMLASWSSGGPSSLCSCAAAGPCCCSCGCSSADELAAGRPCGGPGGEAGRLDTVGWSSAGAGKGGSAACPEALEPKSAEPSPRVMLLLLPWAWPALSTPPPPPAPMPASALCCVREMGPPLLLSSWPAVTKRVNKGAASLCQYMCMSVWGEVHACACADPPSILVSDT